MMQYGRLEEAQAAIGRPLTFLETLWFHHTTNVSHFHLYCCNILFLLITFTIVPLPSVLLDVFRVRAFEKYKLQPGIHTPGSVAFQCYKDVMFTFFVVVGPLQISSYPVFKMLGFRSDLPLPSFGEIVSQLLVYVLIEDYGNYWLHRWLHTDWAYNNIHFVHHKFIAPMSFAAPYAHWLEVLILGIPTFVGPALVPGHMITFWLWIAFRNIEALETHCGYDFPWTPTKLIPFYGGAEYHDYHHFIGGKSKSNFASVFTFCDHLYGTDKGYRYQKEFLLKMRHAKLRAESSSQVDSSIEVSQKTLDDKKTF